MKHSSTSDTVHDVYNQNLSHLNNKKISCLLFQDLAKAFDCISNDIVLQKLKKYGVRGLSLK